MGNPRERGRDRGEGGGVVVCGRSECVVAFERDPDTFFVSLSLKLSFSFSLLPNPFAEVYHYNATTTAADVSSRIKSGLQCPLASAPWTDLRGHSPPEPGASVLSAPSAPYRPFRLECRSRPSFLFLKLSIIWTWKMHANSCARCIRISRAERPLSVRSTSRCHLYRPFHFLPFSVGVT